MSLQRELQLYRLSVQLQLQLIRLGLDWQLRNTVNEIHYKFYRIARCLLWWLRRMARAAGVARVRWIELRRREYYRRQLVFRHICHPNYDDVMCYHTFVCDVLPLLDLLPTLSIESIDKE